MSGELFAAGGATSGHQEWVESVLQIVKAEIQTLYYQTVVYLDQSRKCEVAAKEAMEAREERGPDPDLIPAPIDEEMLERVVRRAVRAHYEPNIHISNRGRSGSPKWLNKVILAVAVSLIVGAITTTAATVVTVSSIRTMLTDYIKSNDQRVSRVEQQTDANTRRLDRGAGL